MKKALSEMTLEELWDLFPISLTAHNDKWAAFYDEMEQFLSNLLSDYQVMRISHIGSTAVNGIWAKDIVDILLEISADEDMDRVARTIENAGFIRMSAEDKRISLNWGYTEHGFAEKVYHLHIRYAGDHDELFFRDYLNEHGKIAKEYEQLKLDLCRKFEHNRDAYTNAKSEFIQKWTAEAKLLYADRYQETGFGQYEREEGRGLQTAGYYRIISVKGCVIYMELTREQALALLREYNQEPFHLRHALTVESVMGWYARELGYGEQAEFWSIVGLLHDLDFERWPDEHCVKARELMEERGLDPALIHAVCAHGWGMTGTDARPEHEMEKVLFAADELTGLIGAAALMRPSKSTKDMELKSLKKKFKDKKFAAGCSREAITQGAQLLGWELDSLLERTLFAMQAGEDDIEKAVAEL